MVKNKDGKLLHVLNWQKFYDMALAGTKIEMQGYVLQRDKDYKATEFVHSGDSFVITVEGIGHFAGKALLHYNINLNNDKPEITLDRMEKDLAYGEAHIPESVRIGDTLFSVTRGSAYKKPEGSTVILGECRKVSKEIFVSELGDPDYERYVFLHEVCHGIMEEFCKELPLSKDDEEDFVEAFSRGLHEVIKANPGVFTDG